MLLAAFVDKSSKAERDQGLSRRGSPLASGSLTGRCHCLILLCLLKGHFKSMGRALPGHFRSLPDSVDMDREEGASENSSTGRFLETEAQVPRSRVGSQG